MPVRLILTLVLVVLVAVLTGFNLSNKCSIWFFYNFKDIPVFAALLVSFILGVLVTLPFTFKKKEKKLDKEKKLSKSKNLNKDEKSKEQNLFVEEEEQKEIK